MKYCSVFIVNFIYSFINMPRVLLLSNPRSGSSYLQELLNSHDEVEIAEELLNDEFGFVENPLAAIQTALGELHSTIVGFKVFPEQIFQHGLNFTELLQTIGATHVIVLWRENLLETLASRRIADANGQWYSTEKNNFNCQISIDENDLRKYIVMIRSEWKKIGTEWPVDVRPIFIKFEDLIRQPVQELKRVFAELSCNSEHTSFKNTSVRQNPSSVDKKVTNFYKLSAELRNEKLDVENILKKMINLSLQIPVELIPLAPDREPFMPAGGWRYPVAEPYLPAKAKQNVYDAIQSGSISSAGYWPRQLAARLRAMFHCPVAQPCSNGFTALMLALQAANIGKDEEVLIPTMTMIAVPNAVRYLSAKPVFVDNAKNSYNPMWADYEKQVSSKTKAVIVTHTYGVPAQDIEEIAMQCKSRRWTLIEDISECVGVSCTTSSGDQRLLGTFGNFAISSLYANKIVHGGDGGFVIAKEANIGKRLASIVNHGFTPTFHFVHFECALNAKIHGVGAAIACGCLDDLDIVIKHRSQLSQWYRENLKYLPVKLMPQCGPLDTPWVFGIQCKSKVERTELRAFMARQGIETRDYFFNLHLQPAYRPEEGRLPPALPNAEILGSTGFYLPTHSNLDEADVEYICGCIKLFFKANAKDSILLTNSFPIAAQKALKRNVQVDPSGFALEIRKYRKTGEVTGVLTRGHVYIEAVKLGIEAENILIHERYDEVKILLKNMKACIAEATGDPLEDAMKNFFLPFINYFESNDHIEQCLQRPWLLIDLNDKLFHISSQIPTTTDAETLQLLVWILIQQKPETIWEIGSWMGHSTVLMSEVCSNIKIDHKIFACDAFRWQSWMFDFIPNNTNILQDGKSFLDVFEENVKTFAHNVQPIIWLYDISELPTTLKNNKPQFVFLDITQEDEDLEKVWSLIEAYLIPNETILLFNGLSNKSISFFTRHRDQLKPLAKPHTIAKAFRFVSTMSIPTVIGSYAEVQKMMQDIVPLKRNIKFLASPAWNHHHNNLFCKSIEILKQHLHSSEGDVLFVPAVEEALCDEFDVLYMNAWIGIIHSVEEYPDLFYTPDLKRLCTNPRYIAVLKNCRGLFTLTSFQADYLRKNLPENLQKFPIQKLYYPVEVDIKFGSSLLQQLIMDEKIIDIIHVGSFARDFEFFFQLSVPPNYRKVLLAGDEECQKIAVRAPSDIIVLSRLAAEDYEEKLKTSIVLLTLKYDGAANTIIMECIARNIPILSPNFSSCTDYLGLTYPLLYDPSKPDEIKRILNVETVNNAISYLKSMDKTKFSQETFVNSVKTGAVLISLPPNANTMINSTTVYNDALINLTDAGGRVFQTYDITICICSYKRTHHLEKLLEQLWNHQDFIGTYQILLWNNNDNRSGIVRLHTMKYIQQSTDRKSLIVINSTENYYCSIRFALPPLLKSNNVLICDDDIIPGSNFISFFYSAHLRNPEDVLCVRGHQFLPHELNTNNPINVWMNYDNLRFRDDNQREQLIHFVHADACLIPKKALHEVSSVPIPDPTFNLVDDYWMSFILNNTFNRKLRKLSVAGLAINPINRTKDSDQPGLALHTRPEVQDARLRLYVHHMLQGWPKWELPTTKGIMMLPQDKQTLIRNKKETFWNRQSQIGFNVYSMLDDDDISDLIKMGVKCVRIGAVGVGETNFFELSGFLTKPQEQLERLRKTVKRLGNAGIDVVITLKRTLASPEIWKLIAEEFSTFENVIGYDLLNEPFTKSEEDLHWVDLESNKVDAGMFKIFKIKHLITVTICYRP